MKMPSTPATTAVRATVGMSSLRPPLATPPPSSARPGEYKTKQRQNMDELWMKPQVAAHHAGTVHRWPRSQYGEVHLTASDQCTAGVMHEHECVTSRRDQTELACRLLQGVGDVRGDGAAGLAHEHEVTT